MDLCCPNLNLFDDATAEDIKALSISDDDTTVTCEATTFFLPAPWLRNAVLVDDSFSPFDLIITAKKASDEVMQSHCREDEDLKSEILAHTDGFISWEWGIGH